MKEIDAKRKIFESEMKENLIVVANSGIGKVNSASMTEYLINHYSPDFVINTGCAGSLRSDVKIMDVVLSTYVTYHDFTPTRIMEYSVPDEGKPKASEKLITIAKKILEEKAQKYFVAPLCSGDSFVTNNKMRDEIQEKTGAFAVDMESGSIGHVCRMHEVPFVCIRTISDFADGNDDFEKEAAYKSSYLVENIIKSL